MLSLVSPPLPPNSQKNLSSVCCHSSVAKLCLTLSNPVDYSPPGFFLCPWNFPGKNTRVGCHFPLLRIFPTQGSNLCLLHQQADSLPLRDQGSPLMKLSIVDKESTCQCRRHRFNLWVKTMRRKWPSTPVFLPGKSHGQRSLVGYSP